MSRFVVCYFKGDVYYANLKWYELKTVKSIGQTPFKNNNYNYIIEDCSMKNVPTVSDMKLILIQSSVRRTSNVE